MTEERRRAYIVRIQNVALHDIYDPGWAGELSKTRAVYYAGKLDTAADNKAVLELLKKISYYGKYRGQLRQVCNNYRRAIYTEIKQAEAVKNADNKQTQH